MADKRLPRVRDDYRTKPKPDRTLCQHVEKGKRCRFLGHGRWCPKHTPSEGAGLVRCFTCGDPVADHSLSELPCRGKGGTFQY